MIVAEGVDEEEDKQNAESFQVADHLEKGAKSNSPAIDDELIEWRKEKGDSDERKDQHVERERLLNPIVQAENRVTEVKKSAEQKLYKNDQ